MAIGASKDDGRVCFAACPQNVIDSGQCICNNRSHNLVKLIKVVVTFNRGENLTYESVWVRETLTKDEIADHINKEVGTGWHSYDIQN